MSAASDPLLVYVRADGVSTPPLLLTPEPDWTGKLFARIALTTMGADRSVPRVPFNRRTGEAVPVETALGATGLQPYDVIEFRHAPPSPHPTT